ncbi:MAG: DUF2619 domain-containing protein [Bacillota bacterium]
MFLHHAVAGMALVRLLSASLEFCAAMLMVFHFRTPAEALRLNAILGLVGPLIFVTVSCLGLAGLARELPGPRILLVVAGVILIILGTRS